MKNSQIPLVYKCIFGRVNITSTQVIQTHSKRVDLSVYILVSFYDATLREGNFGVMKIANVLSFTICNMVSKLFFTSTFSPPSSQNFFEYLIKNVAALNLTTTILQYLQKGSLKFAKNRSFINLQKI